MWEQHRGTKRTQNQAAKSGGILCAGGDTEDAKLKLRCDLIQQSLDPACLIRYLRAAQNVETEAEVTQKATGQYTNKNLGRMIRVSELLCEAILV